MLIFWPVAYFCLRPGTPHRGWKAFGIGLGLHLVASALLMMARVHS